MSNKAALVPVRFSNSHLPSREHRLIRDHPKFRVLDLMKYAGQISPFHQSTQPSRLIFPEFFIVRRQVTTQPYSIHFQTR